MSDDYTEWTWRDAPEGGFWERWTPEALAAFPEPPQQYRVIRQEWVADYTHRTILEAL
jgi:hypothetical protein